MTARFFVVLLICFFSSDAIGQTIQTPGVNFAKADSIAELYAGHSLKDLTALTNKLTKSLPKEIEKVRSIYRWICDNIEYDYPLYLRNTSNKKKLKTRRERDDWDKKFSKLVFTKLVSHHQTVCTGYAYLFKEMANRAGIPCAIVDGYGKTPMSIRSTDEPNHSWNAVQINSKWYLCDPTWSSGFVDTKTDTYVNKFNEAYFLADPSVFFGNHYPSDPAWTLLEKPPTWKEFGQAPMIYSSAIKYRIGQLFPQIFDVETTKEEEVTFQFSTNAENTFMKGELYIEGPIRGSLRAEQFSREANGIYCIDYAFTKKGTYNVHVILDNAFAVSYRVIVK